MRAFANLRRQFSYDDQFADVIREKPVILGYFFSDGRVQGALPKYRSFVKPDGGAQPSGILQLATRGWRFERGYTGNLRPLLLAAQEIAGHANFDLDDDGVVRSAPIFVRHAGRYYASLPLVMLSQYRYYAHDAPLPAKIDSITSLAGVRYGIHGFELGGREFLLNENGRANIRFLGEGGKSGDFRSSRKAVFPYVPMIEVVEGSADRADFDGKIVLIGSSSPQLGDIHTTPVNAAMPGAELVATMLSNLMKQNYLTRAPGAKTNELLVLAGVLAFFSILFVLVGPLWSGLAAALAAGAHFYYVLDQWDSANLIVSLVPALLAVAGLYMVNTVVGFVAEWRASNHLRNTFSQYVPPEFAKRMSESGQKVNLEGEMRELSVLFSDIRNFTGIAENLSPKDLTLLMNEMLTAQSEVIHNHSGTVDKYIGDAVMAFWNAPLADPKHAVNAVLAALDMQAAIRQLSEQIQSEGMPPMRLGVGIATGETNVGNMGSKLRMTYTAIGDNVNIASRVEGLTKFYRVPVLVADGTREQCQNSDIIFRVVDMVRVKGRERPLTLYQPMGVGQTITPATQERVKACEQIWKLYLAGNFAEALNALTRIKDWQKDGLLAVYEERLQTLVKNPPEQWDGVFTHMEK